MPSSVTTRPDAEAATPRCSEDRVMAWLKVAGGFMIFINTYGIASSFGVYQAHYQQDTLKNHSSSTISWIGTTQIFLLGVIGVIAGPMHDRGHARLLLCIGCSMVVIGLLMLSLASSYWQILLSQGICIGVGNGLTYVPAVVTVSHAFGATRPIALGIAASGSAVGGTMFPIVFRQLAPVVGLAWTNRVIGFIVLATSIFAVIVLRPETPRELVHPRLVEGVLDQSAFKDGPYLFLCGGLFLVELGYWIPPFTITQYVRQNINASGDYAFYLLAIMNAGGFAGRVLPPLLTQIRGFGPAWILFIGCLCLGLLVLCWLRIRDVISVTIWAILIGFMSGIAVSVPNSVVPKLATYSTEGARSGMMWTLVSFAALIGAPLANVLTQEGTGSYRNGQMFSGVCICVGSALLCIPAVFVSRKKLD